MHRRFPAVLGLNGGGNKPFFDETTGAVLQGTQICAGSSIDMQILHDLFGYYLLAAEELGVRSPMLAKGQDAREKLVPPQMGANGALQEWTEDMTSLEENHRHFSHLYGFYPGRVLWDKRTPELIRAYKGALEERGDGGVGWSMSWKMALWGRLGDGNRADKIFKNYLKDLCCAQLFAKCGRATQVDGTLGATAAICEMLMQSHEGFIRLLPALPTDWADGQFKGVCARGCFELDLKWWGGKVTEVKVKVWDAVKKDDPLLILDDRELKAALLKRQAAITVSQANLDVTRAQLASAPRA